MKTTLYLTRHGETEWNVEGKLQGHKDSPLTNLGKRQAKWLGASLKEIEFDAIYSSPSPRTYQTAEIIREERKIELSSCDSLKEIGLGSWEGQKDHILKGLMLMNIKPFGIHRIYISL
ncbi:histidine phosphatase family protein [Paenibacillus sp. OAS669]|uniref:histidine phosphatase family protein n=1 Tax=Paenibacillus sp. OAS669 TaxID=2663821 RepID=UPI00399FAD3E